MLPNRPQSSGTDRRPVLILKAQDSAHILPVLCPRYVLVIIDDAMASSGNDPSPQLSSLGPWARPYSFSAWSTETSVSFAPCRMKRGVFPRLATAFSGETCSIQASV